MVSIFIHTREREKICSFIKVAISVKTEKRHSEVLTRANYASVKTHTIFTKSKSSVNGFQKQQRCAEVLQLQLVSRDSGCARQRTWGRSLCHLLHVCYEPGTTPNNSSKIMHCQGPDSHLVHTSPFINIKIQPTVRKRHT